MVASIILNVFGLLFFLQALRRSPMSLTIPLLSFTPVGTTLLDWAFKGQVLAPLQWGGIALVVSGAVALGARTSTWPGLCTYVKDSGVRRMAAAALIWSCTAVLDQTALARGANAWYAPALSLGVGFTLALWLLVARHSASLVRSVRTLVRVPLLASCALILGAAALAVQLEALRHAPVGFIETVKRGIGMSGAVIFGRLFFGEPLSSMKLLAVLLLTAGVGLVVMAI
jgi:multidrug transporter EmrE-like cation transporter